jgi:cyclophilin family peptidyl-prolyl cis-trans isomerase
MKRFSRLILVALAFCVCLPVMAADMPRVRIQTTMGDIVLELNPDKAPTTVANFLQYVNDGFYSGTIFHRVIPNFMIQGGGFSADYQKKPTLPPIRNEADNGLRNDSGTIAMARTGDPHSATSPDARGWGYTVFGKVVEGMDVVNKIRTIPTGSGGPFRTDVPKTTVVIENASLIPAGE